MAKKKIMKQKGFINIIIIAVVALIIAAMGYFALTRKSAEAPATNQETEITKDWKTYRNEDYGYEFEYPGNWSYSQNFREYPHVTNISISFIDSEGLAVFSIRNPIPEIGYEPFITLEREKIKIKNSNKQLEKIISVLDTSQGESSEKPFLERIEWNKEKWGKSGSFFFSYKNESDPNKKIMDQILYTFKFIE